MPCKPSFIKTVLLFIYFLIYWANNSYKDSVWRLCLNNYFIKLHQSNQYHFHFRSALQLVSHNAQVITHHEVVFFLKWELWLYHMQAHSTKKKQHYFSSTPYFPSRFDSFKSSSCNAQHISISKKYIFNILWILCTPICKHIWASEYKGSLYAKLKRTE